MDRVHANSTARRNTAALIGLVFVAATLLACADVGRTFTMRQLNERYSAEDVIGEKQVAQGRANGRRLVPTSGRNRSWLLTAEVTGAGDATVHGLIQLFAKQPIANPNSNSNCGNLEARK